MQYYLHLHYLLLGKVPLTCDYFCARGLIHRNPYWKHHTKLATFVFHSFINSFIHASIYSFIHSFFPSFSFLPFSHSFFLSSFHSLFTLYRKSRHNLSIYKRERPDLNTGNSVAYSFRIVCGFLNLPQLS